MLYSPPSTIIRLPHPHSFIPCLLFFAAGAVGHFRCEIWDIPHEGWAWHLLNTLVDAELSWAEASRVHHNANEMNSPTTVIVPRLHWNALPLSLCPGTKRQLCMCVCVCVQFRSAEHCIGCVMFECSASAIAIYSGVYKKTKQNNRYFSMVERYTK